MIPTIAMYQKQFNETLHIRLHTVKWSNSYIQNYSV